MADPLSQLRQFHINGREIKEHNGYIIFGDHGWPKNVNTNYLVYSTDDDKSKKEYYTLECLLYFLKNVELAHHHYVKEAGSAEIPAVHRPDRKNLIAYLKGEQQTSASIDKNAPIPPLRLSTAEIYKQTQDHHSLSSELQPSTSSQLSNLSSQNDASRGGDNSASTGQKRSHDSEMERKLREEFAARLYNEPKNKKLATIIPAESVEKSGQSAEGSAALSKFGAERIAALRAKHLAVKRTTIIDADLDVGKSGAGSTAPSKEAEALIAMDSVSSKLIKSKEKVWRTRSSILQAQSKNFYKTVFPLVALLEKSSDSSKRGLGQMPPVPTDMQMNSYQQQQQQQHQQQQQQTIHRNAYNRYDQERFVKKLDIGVEIDTNKSFVSGVANGIGAHNSSQQAISKPPTNSVPTSNIGRDGSVRTHHGRPIERSSDSRKPVYKKRTSLVPIIIIPATTTSLINMYNASAILQDHTYVEGTPNRARESDIMIQRKKADGTHAFYKIIDNPLKLEPEDWNRVVAVFVQGPAWQFKGWPWGGSPVEIFSRIKGFHLKWDESKLDDNVAKWNVQTLELSRNKRHLDKANLLKFWSSLDKFMEKYKSFLKH